MTRSRSLIVALAGVIVIVVALVLASAGTASAQVTHAGTFSTGPISQTVIYAAVPSSPTAVLVTLCRTSGVSPVQIVVDHTGIFFVEACRTFALTVTESIQVSSASAVSGTYAISLNLASPTPR